MGDVSNAAARLSFLYDIGIVSAAEIVRWADDLIVREDKPSHELIELATASEKGVSGAIRALAVGADIWTPVEDALPKILEAVIAQPNRSPIVAQALYHVAVAEGYKVPGVLNFIVGAEDEFDLALSGMSRFDDVYKRFVQNIKTAIEARSSPNHRSDPTSASGTSPAEQEPRLR